MSFPAQIPKVALLLTSLLRGRDNRGLVSVEVDQLASNTVACSTYDGPMTARSFKKFDDLHKWSQSNTVHLDTMGRPYAMGIHLDSPINVGMSNSKFLACVLVPEDAISNDSDIKIIKRREGTYAFSQYVNQTPTNSWAHVLKMEEALSKEKSLTNPITGWWEQYALTDWDDLVNGRVSRATIGFRMD